MLQDVPRLPIANNGMNVPYKPLTLLRTDKVSLDAKQDNSYQISIPTLGLIKNGLPSGLTTNGPIPGSLLTDNSVPGTKLKTGTVNAGTVLINDSITAPKYGLHSIPSTAYQDNSIPTTAYANQSVTTPKLAANAATADIVQSDTSDDTKRAITKNHIRNAAIILRTCSVDVLGSVDMTLNDADILALNVTPITLVPAQGANTVIVPLYIFAFYTYNTTAFTVGGAADLHVKYAAGDTAMTIETTGFLDQVTNQKRLTYPTVTAAITPLDNTDLVIDAGAAITDGGTSTVRLMLFYRVVAI